MSDPRILIVNADYPAFLEWFYRENAGLAEAPYSAQLRARAESLFGVADFYSRQFCALGWEAVDVHANNVVMQGAWAVEHGVAGDGAGLTESLIRVARRARGVAARTPLRRLKSAVRPAMAALDRADTSAWSVLGAQIEAFRPDIVFNTAVGVVGSRFLRRFKPSVRLLVGQIASPLPPDDDLKGYDLIVSSLPNFVQRFRQLGVASELSRFAFESSILTQLRSPQGAIEVSFVGSLSRAHGTRVRWLESIVDRSDLRIWGPIDPELGDTPLLRRHCRSAAWGRDMYQILADSRITLNCHIGVADSYANNMRLFEATGVGTLLVTDWKENLQEMFDVGKDVVAYRTPEECVEIVAHFLSHEDERRQIAERGQARTLAEHTYEARTQQLAVAMQDRL